MEQVQVQMAEEEHAVQTMMMKGKRTKRQRLPSPLRLAMSTTMPSSTSFDLATPTTTARITEHDDEDMANCLILLAQGGRGPHHNRHNNNNKKESLFNLYDCKTCNRSFPSFQALGGHRASHKKPKILSNTSTTAEQNYHNDPTSTALTLQISSNRSSSLYGTTTAMETTTTATPYTSSKTNNNNKVHECSICGAEFTSGQALGGHMRRHRGFLTMSSAATATTTTTTTSSSVSGANATDHQENKNNILKLDLNLPAPEDDHHHHQKRESSKLSFQSKEKVIVFSSAANSLVDCHY